MPKLQFAIVSLRRFEHHLGQRFQGKSIKLDGAAKSERRLSLMRGLDRIMKSFVGDPGAAKVNGQDPWSGLS